MDKLIDFIRQNAATFREAPGVFVILAVLGFGAGFAFARYVVDAGALSSDAGALSSKDATIENLKTQMEGSRADRDALTKKLASMSGKDTTIESLNSRIAPAQQVTPSAKEGDAAFVLGANSKFSSLEPVSEVVKEGMIYRVICKLEDDLGCGRTLIGAGIAKLGIVCRAI